MGVLISWADLKQKHYEKQPFLIDPYIPNKGVVFLYGATSTGKSPCTWEMAKCIGAGVPFFGLPTQQGRVLYIDVDTPEQVAALRLQRERTDPREVFFYFTSPLSIPNLGGTEHQELIGVRDEIKPSLVIFNTLRQVHDLDDKDSKAPKIVYTWAKQMFPEAAVLFVHHAKKSTNIPGQEPKRVEGFSGSQAWVNDAQVGLKLEAYNGEVGKNNLRLYHIKTQATQKFRPLPLHLAKDGYTLSSHLYDELLGVYMLMGEAPGGMGKGAFDEMVAKELKIGASTAKKRRLEIESGHFPTTSKWLGREIEGEEE